MASVTIMNPYDKNKLLTGGETLCPPPPADGSLTSGRSISIRERVHLLLMAKLQAASMPIAYGRCAARAAATWDRQTDRLWYHLMPPMTGGIIAAHTRAHRHPFNSPITELPK